jgi:hypothetical protein
MANLRQILLLAKLTEQERLALAALCVGPLSAKDLAERLRLSHFVRANHLLGQIGKKIYRCGGASYGCRPLSRGVGWYHVVAPGFRIPNFNEFYWNLRPNIRRAVLGLGWLGEAPKRPQKREYHVGFEGAEVLRLVTAYERDPKLREECIAIHGLKCLVCGFDFEAKYGKLGRGFIHVHHLEPLSVRNGTRETKVTTDLAPVCPNCHAMIHRGGITRSLRAIRKAVQAANSE